MQNSIYLCVSDKPLIIQHAVDFVSDQKHGAVDVFIGTVRNNIHQMSVTGITYDMHAKITENVFRTICEEAMKSWDGVKIYLAHYRGYIDVGGISVLIAVGSPHRSECMNGCRYIIEQLKIRAPIWKQEHYKDGSSEWLPGHSLIEAVNA